MNIPDNTYIRVPPSADIEYAKAIHEELVRMGYTWGFSNDTDYRDVRDHPYLRLYPNKGMSRGDKPIKCTQEFFFDPETRQFTATPAKALKDPLAVLQFLLTQCPMPDDLIALGHKALDQLKGGTNASN